MKALRPDEVLAVEPGGTGLEARRHRQFAEDHARLRDWFYPSPRLLAHIDDVRSSHPAVANNRSALPKEEIAAMSTDEVVHLLRDLRHVEAYAVLVLRDQGGMSQSAIAELFDVSHSKVSRMARQAERLTVDELAGAERGFRAVSS